MISLTGKDVFRRVFTPGDSGTISFSIDPSLPGGIYLVHLRIKDKNYSARLMVK
jgi:hypothetical protein